MQCPYNYLFLRGKLIGISSSPLGSAQSEATGGSASGSEAGASVGVLSQRLGTREGNFFLVPGLRPERNNTVALPLVQEAGASMGVLSQRLGIREK